MAGNGRQTETMRKYYDRQAFCVRYIYFCRKNKINIIYVTDKKHSSGWLAQGHSINKNRIMSGSRNSPIDIHWRIIRFFTCYSVTDGRSAGFFCRGSAGIAWRKTGRAYFGYGFAEYPSGCGGSLLPTCSSYRHIGRPSGEPG